jgi:hypothetical protein
MLQDGPLRQLLRTEFMLAALVPVAQGARVQAWPDHNASAA